MRNRQITRGGQSGGLRGPAILFFLVLFPAILGVSGCKKKATTPAPPPEVQVISVSMTNMPVFEEWIGTTEGYVNAQIRAQVSGYLQTQNYAEGSVVKKGDLLFQIDPRPFQAALDQAKARLAQDEAQLERTRLDVERFTPLAKDKAISQQELDNARQENLAAQALVKADRAAIETAELNLGFTRITSPIDGVAGLAQVQIGDLVGPGSGTLTTVSTIDPIKVYFQVNEHSYLTFWQQFVVTDGNSISAKLPLVLILSDGSTYPEKGKFFFVNREVSVNAGTVQIAGLFPNPKLLLRPGQYARVRAQTNTRTNAVLIPQRAVMQLQDSYQVAVVGESNQVKVVPIKVGEQIGANWLIQHGLEAGQRVVVEGTQKAKTGTVVNPIPFGGQTNQTAGK